MNFGYKWARWRFNTFDENRREFYEDYASALREGLGGPERLVKLAARARRRRTGWAPLYERWLFKMRRMSYAHALQHTVPDYEVMVLTAAEEDGRMEDAMDQLVRSLRLSAKISGAYYSSLISPALGVITILGFFLSYALVVAPNNLQILPLEKWPQLNRYLYAFSQGLVDGGVVLAIALVVFGWLINWSLGNWRGALRQKVDRLPLLPWRGYRERQANNFLVCLAILLQSHNYGPKEALERMRQFASPWLGEHLRKMLARLGKTPSEPARALTSTDLFPEYMMDRIEDHAERSKFTDALLILAFDHGDKQVRHAERQAMFTGFLVKLLVGGVICVIVLANFQFNQAMDAYIQTMR